MHAGWAVPYELWGGGALELLKGYEGRIAGHNISFDWRMLTVNTGVALPWHKLDDTMILAALDEPGRVKGLKELSSRLIDRQATAGQHALHEGMKKEGWTWANVPVTFAPYWIYAALDTVLTAHLWHYLAPRVANSCPQVYELEMGVSRVCSNMMLHGMMIDRTYVRESIDKMTSFAKEARAWLKDAHDITSPLSAVQIANALELAGYTVEGLTPTGKPKVDKELLEGLRDGKPGVPQQIAEYVLGVRHAEKIVSTYLENFLTTADTTGMIHPQIWTLQAVTGRMCIPDSHRLLTQRGVLNVADVQVGDLTLDASENWVPVQAIHRYTDAETIIYAHRNITFEATAEHRWVMSIDGNQANSSIEPISNTRRTLHLTPASSGFDFRSHEVPLDGTDSVQFAAVIGWLVSDGRCCDEGHGSGLKTRIYQTERKFYKECLRCIPAEAIMFDRISNGADHHEIGIRSRWLRPRLESAGLAADPLLRTSETLLPWVMTLSLPELHAFFSSVWLADGTTAYPQHKNISCGSPQLRTALQYAGYRLGLRSRITIQKPGVWSNGERYGVKFLDDTVTTRYLTRTPSRSDVWCVTTSSGTFTAWNDGPYLTGNSITEPALQTLHRDDKVVRGSFIPRPGYAFVTCDADQIEARTAAHFSQDAGFIAAFNEADKPGGLDFFSSVASQLFRDEVRKGDWRRQVTKNCVYSYLFGAGLEKMAATAGVSVAQMAPIRDQFMERFPGLGALSRDTMREAQNEMARTGVPAIRTALGKRIPVDSKRIYAGLNYKIQGSAAEIFKQGLLDLDAVGLGDCMVLPVHDEIILEVPICEAHDVAKLVEETLTDRTSYAVPFTWGADVLPERWMKS